MRSAPLLLALCAGCSFQSFDGLTSGPASEADSGLPLTDSESIDSTTVIDSAADDSSTFDSAPFDSAADSVASDSAADSVAFDSAADSVAFDSRAADSVAFDSAANDSVAVDSADTSTVDTAVVDVATDTAPMCTSNFDCACGEVCSAGKCVSSTDCTKDSHFCPSGVTCKCIAGRWDIDGTGATATALVSAQPASAADNGADLNLRDYRLHDTSGTTTAMRIRPANCTSGWHYKNINIQCVDFEALSASGPSAFNLSRKGDSISCRPPTPPNLLLDRVNLITLDGYSLIEDVEYAKVTLRKVYTDGGGILIAAFGPGKIAELDVEDSPNIYTELQGAITKVYVKTSPGFRWWTTSPSETRSATWPLITIVYDKASCPARTLANTPQVKESCTST